MMPFLLQDLESMRHGWLKVATRIRQPIHVFRHRDRYTAVTNVAQGVGEHVETIDPEKEVIK